MFSLDSPFYRTPANVRPSGAHSNNSLSQDQAAAYVARSYTLLWAAGVSRFYRHAWDNLRMGLLNCDGKTLKPSAGAYAQIEKWLVDARMQSCASTSDGTWMCNLVRNNRRRYIVWHESQAKSFQIPSSWYAKRVTDLTGGQRAAEGTVEIGAAPQLVE